MTLSERYKNGETREVYTEIHKLGQDAFLPEIFVDVESVLVETFERVAYNLEIIYTELKNIDYVFFDRPYHKPLPNTDTLLKNLDKVIETFGFVPLSLKYFYKIVGGVDFAWNYDKENIIPWELADPIQIGSLDGLVTYVIDEDWEEYIQGYIDNDDYGFAFLELSADSLHKDDISGGSPYSLKIEKTPTIDNDFVEEPHGTTFIDYLRICFDYCGFPGNPDSESYREFVKKVKPKLKPI